MSNKQTKAGAKAANRAAAHLRTVIRHIDEAQRETKFTVAAAHLADLLHYCDREGLDFAAIERKARGFYLREIPLARSA